MRFPAPAEIDVEKIIKNRFIRSNSFVSGEIAIRYAKSDDITVIKRFSGLNIFK